jgi:hypothetical protein
MGSKGHASIVAASFSPPAQDQSLLHICRSQDLSDERCLYPF